MLLIFHFIDIASSLETGQNTTMCCCKCYTKRCCCGCMDRVAGIKIMTIIDIAIHSISFFLLINFQQWLFIMGHVIEVLILISFVADALLLASMCKFNACFIAFWMIYRIFYIMGIFIGWISIGNVIYHDLERRYRYENGQLPPNSWFIAWGCALAAIISLPFYNIHYFIVVKSYRKDNLATNKTENDQPPPVQYTARNAQVFIITRPTPEYDQNPPDYGHMFVPPNHTSPSLIEFYNIQGSNHTLGSGTIDPMPPYYNNKT